MNTKFSNALSFSQILIHRFVKDVAAKAIPNGNVVMKDCRMVGDNVVDARW